LAVTAYKFIVMISFFCAGLEGERIGGNTSPVSSELKSTHRARKRGKKQRDMLRLKKV